MSLESNKLTHAHVFIDKLHYAQLKNLVVYTPSMLKLKTALQVKLDGSYIRFSHSFVPIRLCRPAKSTV